jgi:hypothetical protein
VVAVLAQHSAATVEHGTPHEVVALARHVFGPLGIQCDPFSSPYWNGHVIKADLFYTEGQDALSVPERHWVCAPDPLHATYFINAPGGLVKEAWAFARARWLEGAAVFWVGFNIEQLSYLQGVGAMYRGFQRVIPPRRLAFLRRPGDVAADLRRRAAEAPTAEKADALIRQLERFVEVHRDPNGPPVRGLSPTHSNFLLLMPSELDQVERFEGAARLMNAEAF